MAAVVVTHDNEEDIGRLLDDLPAAMGDLSWRVVVKDNGSTDRTLDVVRRCPEVIIAPDTSDLGYSRGLNHALATAGDASSYLVLKADVRLQAGSVVRLAERVSRPTVGAAVPLVLDAEGRPTPSLRFEPSFLRAVGDAVLGDHFPDRPRWITEVDHDVESYRHAHPVDWAVGDCVLVRRGAMDRVGPWDEPFFSCSEESRLPQAGAGDRLHRLVRARIRGEPSRSCLGRVTRCGSPDGDRPCPLRVQARWSPGRRRHAPRGHPRGARSHRRPRPATHAGHSPAC